MSKKTITIMLVRHAEYLTHDTNQPLSQAGHERAKLLARMIGEVGITDIYSSDYLRTIQTAGPLAGKLGLKISNISEPDELVEQVLLKQDGKKIFICGHTNTVPEVIKQLGGAPINPIPDSEFDNMYILTHYTHNDSEYASINVVHLKYGSSPEQ
ncbi:phosphoglycerate mutase family protein [Pelosinus baikalensis]|uniref:Histidine phosphatase family protein n=1 Tax=Pelosinus baikalensis TaxID=2892015 RepID=A0ABS8HMX2_9FIRM|nr:phosphoglycerate mutase family protein [Pelosinus baikalensis]MCC5464563.1 histidine phosphatase family protein [Pelosinus baikalensis]